MIYIYIYIVELHECWVSIAMEVKWNPTQKKSTHLVLMAKLHPLVSFVCEAWNLHVWTTQETSKSTSLSDKIWTLFRANKLLVLNQRWMMPSLVLRLSRCSSSDFWNFGHALLRDDVQEGSPCFDQSPENALEAILKAPDHQLQFP